MISPPRRETDLVHQGLKYREGEGTSRKGTQPNLSQSLPEGGRLEMHFQESVNIGRSRRKEGRGTARKAELCDVL